MIVARFVDSFDEEWESVPSLDVRKNTVLGSPSAFVAVEQDHVPCIRIMVHIHDESECFSGVYCVGGVVAIGYGEHVSFVDVATKEVKSVALSGYFGHLYTPEEFGLDIQAFDFLVASAETLLRFGRDGTIMWEAQQLGIDGVIVHDIKNSNILGSGEWNPPGGWQPFTVRLSDGLKAV